MYLNRGETRRRQAISDRQWGCRALAVAPPTSEAVQGAAFARWHVGPARKRPPCQTISCVIREFGGRGLVGSPSMSADPASWKKLYNLFDPTERADVDEPRKQTGKPSPNTLCPA